MEGEIERRAVHDMRVPMADADGVAIGSRARDPPHADAAAAARHIFNDDGLAERGPHVIGQNARQRVGRPACRVGHDHGDRPRRIELRGGAGEACCEKGNRDSNKLVHMISSQKVTARSGAARRMGGMSRFFTPCISCH